MTLPTAPAPVCSVCIANYNGMPFIDACVQSVLAQDCSFSVEIIIHDDASTDDSVAHIKKNYPDVVLLAGSENVGFCISNNRMVDVARGRYVLLLNNDAELFPDALSTLYAEAERLGEPAVLGLPQYDASTNELIDIGSRFDMFLNPIPNRPPSEPQVGMIIGACLWLPQSLWKEIGGFPDWFGSLAEDMYLCLLARLYGYQVMALPASGFRHWVGQSLGGGKVVNNRLSSKLSRRIVSERNKTFVMIVTYPSPYLQILLPLHFALLLIEGLVLAGVKRRWIIFRDIYWACIFAQWRCREKLSSVRASVQAQRKIEAKVFFGSFQKIPHKLSLLLKHGFPHLR